MSRATLVRGEWLPPFHAKGVGNIRNTHGDNGHGDPLVCTDDELDIEPSDRHQFSHRAGWPDRAGCRD